MINGARKECTSRIKSKEECDAWCGPDAKEEQLLALQAKLDVMMLHLKKRNDGMTNSGSSGKGPHGKGPKIKDWMIKKQPRKESIQHKNYKGDQQTHHWCPKHVRYVVHKPSECRLEQKESEGNITANMARVDCLQMAINEEDAAANDSSIESQE